MSERSRSNVVSVSLLKESHSDGEKSPLRSCLLALRPELLQPDVLRAGLVEAAEENSPAVRESRPGMQAGLQRQLRAHAEIDLHERGELAS
eukprot:105432-Hanusia_phi.AAC.4